ncbi:MAG TPA: hypothetical protein VEZ14_09415 [Dehalococcoidia bacterium]|nr:hypothetical protein [Dehalococcoidia bacterium]
MPMTISGFNNLAAAEGTPPPLRPYQQEAGRAIVESVRGRLGRSITVEIARQGGKNELSAQVELLLLAAHAARGGDAVKCAPTFRPQLSVSRMRLWQRVLQSRLQAVAAREPDAIRIGRARIAFLSAAPTSNVVGHTASLLLEVDEAQGVDPEKFDREFRPMAAACNATTVYYGTAWDDRTLLERAKQANLEAERRDGVRRHFQYDWQAVAAHLPAYARFVEGERVRLGETHPLFVTQYCLKPIAGGGRLFSAAQRAQLAGDHPRLSQPRPGAAYVAGLDIAGGDDEGAPPAEHDATVLTIGRVVYPPASALITEPRIDIVEHYAWTGEPHETLLPRLVDLLHAVWRVHRVAVDATGLGETIARLLDTALGRATVVPLKFTADRKSTLGFDLLAAVNGGRLKVYAGDGSPESREFWRQAELARVAYRANRTMNFFLDPTEGHDDYLVSAALLVHASLGETQRVAMGRVRAAPAG